MEGVWRKCGGSVEQVRECGGSVEGVWRECGVKHSYDSLSEISDCRRTSKRQCHVLLQQGGSAHGSQCDQLLLQKQQTL